MLDAQRALIVALLIDVVLYSYSLVAFGLHALTSLSCIRDDNDDDDHEPLFALHDEPLLLLHSGHALMALTALYAFSCARESRRMASVLVIVGAAASQLDVAATYVHVVMASDHGHTRALRYAYAFLGGMLTVSSIVVAVRARRVARILDPAVYALSSPPNRNIMHTH